MRRFASRFLKIAAPAVVILAGLGAEARADLITTLYDTGTTTSTSSGSTLATGGSTSTHYTLSGQGYSSAIVASTIPSIYTTASDALWVGPGADLTQNYVGGLYTYTTTFSLSGFVASSAAISGKIAADDYVSVYLNGNLLLTSTNGFSTFTNFSAAAGSGDFVSGTNTLTFVVNNVTPNSPTGLIVSSLVGTATLAVPVPASFLMMGFGSVSAFGLARFRRLRAAV